MQTFENQKKLEKKEKKELTNHRLMVIRFVVHYPFFFVNNFSYSKKILKGAEKKK